MRADARPRRARPSLPLAGLLVSAMLYAWLGSGPAWSADARLDQARADREAAQAKLDDLLQRVSALEAEVSAAEAEVSALTRAENEHQQAASAAFSALSDHVVAAYKHASLDPTLTLLSSGSPQEAADQARILTLLAKRSRAELESASSARVRTHATASKVAEAARLLQGRQAELAVLRSQVEAEVARAQQVEDQVAAQVRAQTAALSSRGAGGSRSGTGRAACSAAPVAV